MQIETKNFPYTYYKWVQDPSSQLQPNETGQSIKFQFKTDQYIEPTTAYLQLTISVNPVDYYTVLDNVGGQSVLRQGECLVLDGPTTALIDNLKIYCNGRLVEHIDGYNHIGQVISDLNIRPEARRKRQDVGLEDGTQSIYSKSTMDVGGMFNFGDINKGYVDTSNAFGGFVTGFGGSGYFPHMQPYKHNSVNQLGQFQAMSLANAQAYATLSFGHNTVQEALYNGIQAPVGNGAAEINESYIAVGGGQALRTNAAWANSVYNGQYGISAIDALQYNFQFNAFAIFPPAYITSSNCHTLQSSLNAQCTNTVGTANGRAFKKRSTYELTGWQIPNCPSLQSPNRDYLISPIHPTIIMYNGLPCGVHGVDTALTLEDNTNFNVATEVRYLTPDIKPALVQKVHTFKIPIISSFIGIMATGFSGLIDGALLGQLSFEFRLNQYAFYVSGGKGSAAGKPYNAQIDSSDLFPRKYSITKAQMIFDTYHPAYTPKDSLGPVEFWANAWTLPQQFSFPDSRSLTAEHQINVGIKSARMMLVRFLSDDYKLFSYCKQQYKISGNVTSYQVKMGSLLFPVNPLQGHAGNPAIGDTGYTLHTAVNTIAQSVQTDADNQEFIDSFNNAIGSFMQYNRVQMFDRIGFCLNGRIWNPRNNNLSRGIEKVYGQPYLFEQVQSQAMYITRFDNLDGFFTRSIQNSQIYDFGWNGIDTTQTRPFTLSIRTDQTNYYKYPLTMQVFFYQDVLVRYTLDGVYIEGGYLQ